MVKYDVSNSAGKIVSQVPAKANTTKSKTCDESISDNNL